MGMEGIPQPEWVSKTISTQDVHFENGYGKMDDKQNSIKRATVDAKSKISERIRTHVEKTLIDHVIDMGGSSNPQAIEAMEIVSQQVAEACLSAVTTEEIWVDSEAGVWVLCSIPLVIIEKNFEPAADAVAEAFYNIETIDSVAAKLENTFSRLLVESAGESK